MRFFIVVTLLLLAHTVSAQVVITEIMYDPEGSDTGYEWIEIENRGSAPVVIGEGKSGWKFFEDGTHHALVSVRGETTLGVGAIGVIADNADNFLEANPSFNGTLFDSSFSLKNTGETIALKNSDGVEESSVSYDPTLGAQGDGNSLQEKDGAWVATSPTPGMRASVGAGVPQPQENMTGGGGGSSSPSVPRGIPTLSLRAKSTVAIVGAPLTFEPRAGRSEEEAYYQWSFGDGATSMMWGARPISHAYYYPGTYTVFLEAPNLNLSAKLSVRAVAPEVSLSTQGDRVHSSVMIENRGSEELDMEKWQLLSEGNTFIFPKLVVASKQSVRLPSEVTRLATPEGGYVELRFPSGARVPIVENTPIAQEIASSTAASFSNVSVKEVSVHAFPVQVAPLIPVTPLVEENAPGIPSSVQAATLLSGEEDHLWQWYTGAALIALFALLGLRFVRSRHTLADEYEIVEDDESAGK